MNANAVESPGCRKRGEGGRVATSTSPATRSGASIATCWAIIPPIDRPRTTARSISVSSSTSTMSPAMSAIVNGTSAERDQPPPRLSTVITRVWAASCLTQARGHAIAEAPKPLTSTSGVAVPVPLERHAICGCLALRVADVSDGVLMRWRSRARPPRRRRRRRGPRRPGRRRARAGRGRGRRRCGRGCGPRAALRGGTRSR